MLQGSLGAPLFDLQGKVIGVIVKRDETGEGLGFAIPINRVKRTFTRYYHFGNNGYVLL